MSIQQLITTTFDKSFKKYLYDEMIIGQLAHSEFKDMVNKGDEVDVTMPGSVNMFDYDGGDLPDPETVETSIAKVKMDKGKGFNFKLKDVEEKLIANSTAENQMSLIKDYTSDAFSKFAAGVDKSYGQLYARAGLVAKPSSGDSIVLDSDKAIKLLAVMRALFKRGDNKGHNSWVDGQMLAILPPEYVTFLTQAQVMDYTETRQEEVTKGRIGKLHGWTILESNDIASSNGVYYPLFGIKGKTLAGGISSDLKTKAYVPEKNFDNAYKGYGLYGVGAPRADFLGTAPVQIAALTV